MDPEDKEKWKVGSLNMRIEDGQMKVTAFDEKMGHALTTRTEIKHMGTWPALLRQGVLTANDALSMLEVGYRLQNNSELSCVPDK
jgi:hypothetical protein